MYGWDRIANFTSGEVACRHCGRENMCLRTMEKIQRARDYLDMPIYGTSFCRCELWNAHVGGVEDSSHLITDDKECEAGDLTLVPLDAEGNSLRDMTSKELYQLVIALYKAGFRRFGINKRFVHVDDGERKRKERMWLYS